jgi:drug/metabolite transporter (DMT)-like permease
MTKQNFFVRGSGISARPRLAFAALIAGNIAISFGPLLVRYADTGPVATGFWRLALALPLLALFAKNADFRVSLIPAGMIWILILSGVFFGLDIIAWHIAIFQTKISNATLFANCASILLVIYGVIMVRQWPRKPQMLGILLAFGGTALLLGQSFEVSDRNFFGDLLCLAAGLLYTFYLIGMIRARETTESWGALAISSGVAALVLISASLMMGEKIIPTNWAPLIILALSSQVLGQGLLTFALPHFNPLIIGLALLLQPAISAAAGWLAFSEVLTVFDIIGGLMVMAALVSVQLSDNRS